jgi:hypothetical protein
MWMWDISHFSPHINFVFENKLYFQKQTEKQGFSYWPEDLPGFTKIKAEATEEKKLGTPPSDRCIGTCGKSSNPGA